MTRHNREVAGDWKARQIAERKACIATDLLKVIYESEVGVRESQIGCRSSTTIENRAVTFVD
jgi:hypothetical protein